MKPILFTMLIAAFTSFAFGQRRVPKIIDSSATVIRVDTMSLSNMPSFDPNKGFVYDKRVPRSPYMDLKIRIDSLQLMEEDSLKAKWPHR